ncbi:hypothetical protein ACQ86N_33895 [Puia sp. P3]|uniref:hypothetical protein n=1 Tax=Puia sp. P3 TaxID=3423952 RepID=UPI003D66F5C0
MVWSPDSKWLAYSQSDLYFNDEVFIQPADNSSAAVNVSMHPRSDMTPFWSPDGSKLGFLSERSVSRSVDVWFVWLKKDDWEKSKEDWQDKDTPAADNAGAAKPKKPVTVTIDFDKIYERVVQVTSFPGDEDDLTISRDGETFYYTTASSTAKGRDLYSIKWDGKDLKELTKGGANPSNVSTDKDGKYLYYNTRMGAMARIDLKTAASENLPYSARLKIDYVKERTQVFEEAWRTMRDGYYDPNFNGYDWNKLREKIPRPLRIRQHQQRLPRYVQSPARRDQLQPRRLHGRRPHRDTKRRYRQTRRRTDTRSRWHEGHTRHPQQPRR